MVSCVAPQAQPLTADPQSVVPLPAFDGPDRLFLTVTNSNSGGVTSGALVRTDAARPAAGVRPADWPWPASAVPHASRAR